MDNKEFFELYQHLLKEIGRKDKAATMVKKVEIEVPEELRSSQEVEDLLLSAFGKEEKEKKEKAKRSAFSKWLFEDIDE